MGLSQPKTTAVSILGWRFISITTVAFALAESGVVGRPATIWPFPPSLSAIGVSGCGRSLLAQNCTRSDADSEQVYSRGSAESRFVLSWRISCHEVALANCYAPTVDESSGGAGRVVRWEILPGLPGEGPLPQTFPSGPSNTVGGRTGRQILHGRWEFMDRELSAVELSSAY
jgi:hypothetical protein